MKIQVKPIGYKFRVTNNDGVFDIESTTELSMNKSDEIIRKFFDNFIIRKSDIRVVSENITVVAKSTVKKQTKSPVDNGANSTMKNIMRSDRRMSRPTGVRRVEKRIGNSSRMRSVVEKNVLEKKPAKTSERKDVMISDEKVVRNKKKPVMSNVGPSNVRESVREKWRSLKGSLKDEFTLQEYVKSLHDAGYKYTKTSWEAVPSQQISRLVKLGEVEKIGGKKSHLYRKIKDLVKDKSEKQREMMKI